MSEPRKTPVIVVADDTAADRKLTVMAFRNALLHNPIHEVKDGEELMHYLRREGAYAGKRVDHEPCLILLDLNMPRKSGLEALAEIKGDPLLRHIPVIILTTSKAEEDIVRSYQLGVNSFITKPVHFDEFLLAIRKLGQYWLELVALPPEDPRP
ncbi:MAG TPA: response regulator [Nevskiales bacterium]|nr:response regulator [Nevskiales bacterium]